MSNNDDFRGVQLIVESHEDETSYGVMLPCEQESFGHFISKLLGKPQIIEKELYGEFKIDKNDVISTYHLINQRINQQNEATLIQFTAKMYFSDKSSVEINTIEDFVQYSEVKRVNCTQLYVTWIYLIKFKNKKTPEKQQINISFGDVRHRAYYLGLGTYQENFITASNIITISIFHTERTWGVDMESLLNTHLSNFQGQENRLKKTIHRYHNEIGLLTGCALFSASTLGAIVTTSRLTKSYGAEVANIAKEASGDILISKKLDYLLSITSTGVWPRFILSLVMFMIIAIMISILVGAWVSSRAESRLQSWILITDNSRIEYDKYVRKLKNNIVIFIGSIILSIMCGIIGNIIFSLYFTKLT